MMDVMDEIKQQGQALRDLVGFYKGASGRKLIKQAAAFMAESSKRPVWVTGMGSSLWAGRVLNYGLCRKGYVSGLLGTDELLGLPIQYDAYEYVLISQSGQSFEPVQLTDHLSKSTSPGLVVTNNLDSPLAKAGKYTLPMCAGQEKLSATKSFTNTLALLAKLAAEINGTPDQGVLDREILVAADQLDELAGDYRTFQSDIPVDFVLGHGYQLLAVAEQAQILFKEMAQQSTEALSLRNFRHGVQELCLSKPGIVLITQQMDDYQKDYLKTISQIGATVFVVSGNECPDDWQHWNLDCEGLQFMLASVVVLELWAYNLAISRDLKPGHFFVGAKVIG